VEPLRQALLQSLERQGGETPRLLEALGEPEPERAVAALRSASRHPDLAPTRGEWLPPLLSTARPGFAARALEDLTERYRARRGSALDPRAVPTLPCVLGSSDFLARLLLRHPDWVEELRGRLPAAPDRAVEADWPAIRAAKYRGLLRIAARDLADRPFEESLRELSSLADRCLDAALRAAAAQCRTAPPALLALGKLGGRELNFSSDVDLLFVYDDPAHARARSEEVSRLVRALKGELEARSEDGFVYRVDLDLRPEGRLATLANPTDAALSYYESFGADWERQMLIRCRFIAGPRPTAESFLEGIVPFVYRRLIDPGAILGVRAMKERIESERRRQGRDLDTSLKEGPGGIRDVEFLVQALQLFHGGLDPTLRKGSLLEALRALEAAGRIPEDVAHALELDYLWLRRAEHAVQMVEERQSHAFPRERAAQIALARRMGYRDEEGERARNRLLDDWTNTRARVREQFDALVLRADAGASGS
jgi:glutamate-ammonia-ligase adenylyltransferase